MEKDLIAIKNNDFTDTSLADLTQHLSYENQVNNNLLIDRDKQDQKTSIMEHQITSNLLQNFNSNSTTDFPQMTPCRSSFTHKVQQLSQPTHK